MKFTGQKKTENILYAALWAILFAAPTLSMYVSSVTSHTETYNWQEVWNAWRMLGVFAIAFYLHNFLLAPLLVYKGRKVIYTILTLLLLAGFWAYQEGSFPHPKPPMAIEGMEPPHPEEIERFERQPRGQRGPQQQRGPQLQVESQQQQTEGLQHTKQQQGKPSEGANRRNRTNEWKRMKREERKNRRKEWMQRHMPPFAFGQRDSVSITIMLLLLGLNAGAKYFFKSTDDRKRMKALERENLTHQLEYLKYQINPHFFMNTLNNIHALVDIDPEQAKHTIEVLSRLMRYMLYEANKPLAPLQKELEFIANYVGLMRIRYAEHVRITVSVPTIVPDVQIPPLLLIIFVENAFKHGISYERESFVEVSVTTDDNGYVDFHCRNSRKPSKEEIHGGMGLGNVKERLQLIYGNDYQLTIQPTENEFEVQLRLPNKDLKTLFG